MNETEVRELFTAAVAAPADDRVDLEAAVRAGRRRRRVRRAAPFAAAITVAAVVGAVLVVGLPGASRTPGPPPGLIAVRPAQLAGLWVARSIEGRDVTGSGQDAEALLTTGAGVNRWQVNDGCGLPVATPFTLGAGGAYRSAPPARDGCLTLAHPGLVDALSRAAFLQIRTSPAGEPVTLVLFARQGQVLARLTADPVPDPPAWWICRHDFGSAVTAAAMTTVGRLRAVIESSAGGRGLTMFPGTPDSTVAAGCIVRDQDSTRSLAVLTDGRAQSTDGPPAGPGPGVGATAP